MAIAWKAAYETGERRVDDQHRKLVQTINDLQAYLRGGEIKKSDVDQLMSFLRMYVTSHFCYEELCMSRFQCPNAQQNKEAHVEFLALFQSFERRYHAIGPDAKLLQELAAMAENWIVNHICRVDMSLKAVIPKPAVTP